jgi:CRISPR-associated protein Csd1
VFDVPDVSEVKNLIESVWTGKKEIITTVDTNMFYSCTLSSAAARIAVRDWTAISLEQYKMNLSEWFLDIEIEGKDKELSYCSLRQLINATQKDKKTGEKQKSDLNSKARIGACLWNAAIKGHSYKIPLEVLQSVLIRLWKGDYFSTERAAIIKLIINRNTNKNMKSTLDETYTSVAYLCGRLFAVIESMQWKAIGSVNSSVKDRFFTAAASQPAYIFGTLLTKNVPVYQHKIGGYLAKDLNEIAGLISEKGKFPQRFTTIEQGEFALGYYFQRNHKKDNESSEIINS